MRLSESRIRAWNVWPAAFAGAVLAFSAALWAAGPAADPSAKPAAGDKPAEVAELIRKLSDNNYKVREDAQKQLEQAGPGAIPALEQALKSRDAEVRQRAEAILIVLRKQAGEATIEALRKNLLWKADLPAGLAAPPVVVDGVVCAVDAKGTLRCLSAKTGKILWERPKCRPDFVVVDKTLYVLCKDGKLRALNIKTGKPLEGFEPVAAKTAPCVLDGKIILARDDKTIVALDAATGKQAWEAPLAKPAAYRPTAGKGLVYVITRDGTLRALNAKDGTEKWKYTGDKAVPCSLTIVGDLLAFRLATKGTDSSKPEQKIVALNAQTGRDAWTAEVDAPRVRRGGMVNVMGKVDAGGFVSPAGGDLPMPVWDGQLCMQAWGQWHGLEAKSGKELWTYKPRSDEEGAQHVIGEDGVRVIRARVQIVVVAGGVRRIVSTGGVGGESRWTASEGVLYIAGAKGLHAVDLKTRQKLWMLPMKGLSEPPVVADGVIYLATGPVPGFAPRAGGAKAPPPPTPAVSAYRLPKEDPSAEK